MKRTTGWQDIQNLFETLPLEVDVVFEILIRISV